MARHGLVTFSRCTSPQKPCWHQVYPAHQVSRGPQAPHRAAGALLRGSGGGGGGGGGGGRSSTFIDRWIPVPVCACYTFYSFSSFRVFLAFSRAFGTVKGLWSTGLRLCLKFFCVGESGHNRVELINAIESWRETFYKRESRASPRHRTSSLAGRRPVFKLSQKISTLHFRAKKFADLFVRMAAPTIRTSTPPRPGGTGATIPRHYH